MQPAPSAPLKSSSSGCVLLFRYFYFAGPCSRSSESRAPLFFLGLVLLPMPERTPTTKLQKAHPDAINRVPPPVGVSHSPFPLSSNPAINGPAPPFEPRRAPPPQSTSHRQPVHTPRGNSTARNREGGRPSHHLRQRSTAKDEGPGASTLVDGKAARQGPNLAHAAMMGAAMDPFADNAEDLGSSIAHNMRNARAEWVSVLSLRSRLMSLLIHRLPFADAHPAISLLRLGSISLLHRLTSTPLRPQFLVFAPHQYFPNLGPCLQHCRRRLPAQSLLRLRLQRRSRQRSPRCWASREAMGSRQED
jgi:hypothetical protein